MKHRIFPLLLAAATALILTAEAQAAALFPYTAEYDDRFVDVHSSDWFYSNVSALYSLGLTNGKGDPTLFAPASDMTVAEALTVAARIRSLHQFGEAEAGSAQFRTDGIPWYAPYVDYLRSAEVISGEFDDHLQAPVTRAEMAHILAAALPADLFAEINADAVNLGYAAGKYISDVDDYTPYQQDILTLYRWGILGGTDEKGTFLPHASIKRSEVAAMVTRLVDSEFRLVLAWDTEDDEIWSLADLIDRADPVSAPSPEDPAAVDAALRAMLSRGERTLSLSYAEPTTTERAEAIMQAFLRAVRCYPEQTYNKVSISYYTNNGEVTLTFSSSLYDDSLIDGYREATFVEALLVREALYANGKLTDTMTEYEKASVYFTWLCENCAYDRRSTPDSMSHSGYNVFFAGLAVCDGYTAAYNLLLGLEGIECRAIDLDSADHMWTVAVLDGVSYHIDPTWGDQTNTIAYRYFAMTEADSMARFQ